MSDYRGPERRREPPVPLETIEELRLSVDTLTGQVATLTGQLEEVNTIRQDQQALDGEARRVFREAREALAQERSERKQDRRHGRGIGLILLALIVGLIVVAWRQDDYQHSTRNALDDLKGHSFASCQVRNTQLAEVQVILTAVVAIEDGIKPPPGGAAVKAKLDQILKSVPGPVDCAKVYQPN